MYHLDNPSVDCIINDNHDYLQDFLEGLAIPEHSATIQDWDTAGRVYLDYIRVIKTLQDIQQVRTRSLFLNGFKYKHYSLFELSKCHISPSLANVLACC